ncbi:MAG: hypothetical protein WD708_02710 [Kiritimatiellia bacterium]
MRTTSKSSLFLHLFLALSLLCGTALFAQEEEESSRKNASSEITQGQAAKLLVRRLGLWQESGIALTQNRAITRLESLNVSPFGGWDAEAPLSVNELARMLAQALGLDSDFSEADKTDPEATAHKEALIAQHNLDVEGLVARLARNRAQLPSAVGRMPDSSESDPITRPNPPETDGLIPTVERVTDSDVRVVLSAVTNVRSTSQNITPSAP